MKRLVPSALFVLALLPAAGGRADEPGPGERRIEVRRIRRALGPGDGADQTMAFSWMGDALEGRPVKGAPFSATAVTEIDQPLADGNRIRQKTTAALARDSAGRTRRELTLGAVGPLVMGEPHTLVHLYDPASGTSTTLDPARRIAFRPGRVSLGGEPPSPATPPPPPPPAGAAGRAVEVHDDVVVRGWGGGIGMNLPLPPPGPGTFELPLVDGLPPDAPKPVREDLGEQVIEGVKAQGHRTTVTIPAGKMGNERPLSIVSERWVSSELGVTVMSKHSDPRLGSTTYRLTGIDRREQPATLFEVPVDYRQESGPAMIQRRLIRKQ
jgi:hypothetical protein